MSLSLSFIRLFFSLLCIFVVTAYCASISQGTFTFLEAVTGITAGGALACILIGIDILLKRCSLKIFNLVLLGTLCGYLLGESIWLILNTILNLSQLSITSNNLVLLKATLFLSCIYISLILTVKAGQEIYISFPFIQIKETVSKKKDLVVDWNILLDARIIDLASSGLLDQTLILPRFVIKELYTMLEDSEEVIRTRGKRCLENLKKLESISHLEMRYSELNFPELRDIGSKLIQLAEQLECNVLTGDANRLQPYVVDNIRIINLHVLSTAFKPITNEQILIKIQRFGKEPRQGVGYLEDGTMVVVNGGSEYMGETIKAQVLSIKHTSSGRMIFCNAAEDEDCLDHSMDDSEIMEMQSSTRSFLSL